MKKPVIASAVFFLLMATEVQLQRPSFHLLHLAVFRRASAPKYYACWRACSRP